MCWLTAGWGTGIIMFARPSICIGLFLPAVRNPSSPPSDSHVWSVWLSPTHNELDCLPTYPLRSWSPETGANIAHAQSSSDHYRGGGHIDGGRQPNLNGILNGPNFAWVNSVLYWGGRGQGYTLFRNDWEITKEDREKKRSQTNI